MNQICYVSEELQKYSNSNKVHVLVSVRATIFSKYYTGLRKYYICIGLE